MAGMLAYAAAGALAGAGKGIENAGTALLKDQMETGLVRLKEQYEDTRQQTSIGAQKDLETQREGYETSNLNQRLTAAGGIAQRKIDTEISENKANRESLERRTGVIAGARTDSAQIAADAKVEAATQAAARAASQKLKWQIRDVQPAQPIDPATGKPDLMQPTPKKIPGILFNPRTGGAYSVQGDRLVPVDPNGKPLYPAQATSRPPTPGEVSDLLSDPLGVVQGGRNAGVPKALLFERAYHYLPRGYDQAANSSYDRVGTSSSSGVGAQAGSGSVITPDAATRLGEIGSLTAPSQPSSIDTGDATGLLAN
jgi:hypothetical protein